MKKIIGLFFFAFFLSGIPVLAEEIRVGFFQWPPLIKAVDYQSKPIGLMVDHYENVVAKKLGVTIKWIGPLPIPRAVYMLKKHEIDIIPVLSKTPTREKIMAFPEKPLYFQQAVVCVQKKFMKEKIESWDDLKGKKLGINYGSAFHKQLSKTQPQLHFASIYHKTNPVKYALELVLRGRLAAYIHPDSVVAKILLKQWNMKKKIKILVAPIHKRTPYTAISLGRPDLLKKWNILGEEIMFQIH